MYGRPRFVQVFFLLAAASLRNKVSEMQMSGLSLVASKSMSLSTGMHLDAFSHRVLYFVFR